MFVVAFACPQIWDGRLHISSAGTCRDYHPQARAYSWILFFVELREITWENEDIMCEDSETPFNEEFPIVAILDPHLPSFNLFLIVHPNDPLFEDEIKVINFNYNNTETYN